MNRFKTSLQSPADFIAAGTIFVILLTIVSYSSSSGPSGEARASGAVPASPPAPSHPPRTSDYSTA